ncbi:EAL domain-containing protein [Rheinheimera aquimaris]|nr:EAL domain-containing protein [Rheinheimera aquimaris]MCB5213067.1 EAL domain-containing protein [Rheinheimera aquimaris]
MNSIHFPVTLDAGPQLRQLADQQPDIRPPSKAVLWPVLCLSIAVLLAGFLLISYMQTERQAKTDLHNLNLTLESRLNAGLLQPLQMQLNSVAQMLDPALLDKSQLQQEQLRQQLQNLASRFPELPPLILLSKYGSALFSTAAGNQALYFSQIPLQIQQHNLPGLLFEQTADNQLALAVPVINHQRELTGWIATSVPLDTVQQLFAQVELGKAGVLTLRRIDPPTTVVRQPQLPGTQTPSYAADLIDQQLAQGHNEGALFMQSRVDAVKRLYSYKRVGAYPFILVTGYATADYLAEWYLSSALAVILSLLICALSAIFSRRLQKTRHKEQRSARELKAKEEYIRLLLHSVGHPIFGLNFQGVCTFSNQSCVRLFGYTADTDLSSTALDKHFVDPQGKHTDLITRLLNQVHQGEEFYCDDHRFIDARQQQIQIEIRAYPNVKNQQLIGAVVTLQDISERKDQEQRISYMAYHDALTGLPNRWFLKDRFEQLMADTERKNGHIALLYLDLDNFKNINDSLGHYAGDAVLHAVAKRLLSFKKRIDTVARLGGDEYLLLVPMAQQHEQLTQLLQDIITEIQQPLQLEAQQVAVTPSIGVAVHVLHGTDFESLLKAADMALYKAKEDGRNTYRFYHNTMGEQGLRRLTLQTELRQALVKQQLFIQYQPQLDLRTGRVVGAEALLRWRHPTEGLISPAEFIPAAEANGMIIPISNWLLRTVCQQAMAWRKQGMAPLVVAVNCSALQFRQGDLVAEVTQALADSGLPAHLLELELTESMLLQDSERVMQIISRLKALGVKLSIDDFGTGYSNMAYLKRFAVDKLKIDQSFVKGIARNADDEAIVQSIITLAHSFNLKAIAEGVEDYATADILLARSCDEVQGYCYAKALDPDAFLDFSLSNQKTTSQVVQLKSGQS